MTGTLLRIVPPGAFARRPHVVLERNARVYKHGWSVLISGFFEPLFYLLSLGTGMAMLIGTVTGPGGQQMTYQEFIAPALLATSAMNAAVYDCTYGFFFKLRFEKVYDGMLATSLGPVDVAVGEMAWTLIRGGLYSSAFLALMVVMGLVSSWWAVLMLPAALLMALAFAALGMAATSFMRGIADFDYIQLGILPMFLFSGTFYGLDVYPTPIRLLIEALPLHHGIALERALAAGVVDWTLLGHVAYFVALTAVGLVVTARRLDKLLLR